MRGVFDSLSFRTSPLFWLAFVACCVAVPFGWYSSRTIRLSNLELGECRFPESFLMISKTRENRGYLLDRARATIRRGDQKPGGRMRNLVRFAVEEDGPESWLVQSKEHGSAFLLAVDDVDDWTCPFFFGFARREFPDLILADVFWTQLHVNRVYAGLYLRVELPFDLRKRDGGSGIRREFLMVEEDRLWTVDTRLDPAARLYHDLVAAGSFPTPRQPSGVAAWLCQRCACGGQTYLLDNVEPWEVAPLPLPVSIVGLFEEIHGYPLDPTYSDRFRQWPAGGSLGPSHDPLTREQRDRLETEWGSYRENFESALIAHRALRGDYERGTEASLPCKPPAGPLGS